MPSPPPPPPPKRRKLLSLDRPVSPPPPVLKSQSTTQSKSIDLTETTSPAASVSPSSNAPSRSPFQLTRIRDLPASENVDTVGIADTLGDLMLREVWNFNYMADIDWVMSHFDADILPQLSITFVHGSWKKESESRIRMEAQAATYENVKLACAYMPEPYGTHHSKLMVLFRRDDTVQIIIHTANMIEFDWTNMTQAMWRSPWLALKGDSPARDEIGDAFKTDFLQYLRFYGGRTAALVEQLKKYDFSPIRAVFVSSVPKRVEDASFGWPRLESVLSKIPSSAEKSSINVQMSSIATLGQNDTWLTPVFLRALHSTSSRSPTPRTHIIFPTADEIRESLNGYSSGSALHCRGTTPAQQKQLAYLRPMMCRWSGRGERDAGRARASPHIKTFMRFKDDSMEELEWALLTSANLSTQAWGAKRVDGKVRICSYETGVLVWPGLWGEDVKMKPEFRRNSFAGVKNEGGGKDGKTVPLRMPYSLPVKRYEPGDEVWCNSKSSEKLDWLGRAYHVS